MCFVETSDGRWKAQSMFSVWTVLVFSSVATSIHSMLHRKPHVVGNMHCFISVICVSMGRHVCFKCLHGLEMGCLVYFEGFGLGW